MPTYTRDKDLVGTEVKIIQPVGGSQSPPMNQSFQRTYGVDYDRKVDPTHRRKKPKGFVPPTAYSRTIQYGSTDRMRISSHAEYNTPGAGYIVSRVYGPDGAADNGRKAIPAFDIAASNRAVQNFRKNMKNQHVNYGVAISEASKTIDLFASTAHRIAKSISHVRRGNIAAAANELGIPTPRRYGSRRAKKAHENWLELQYGWKPLLSDVEGAASEMAEKDLKDPKRYIYTVKGSAVVHTRQNYVSNANVTDLNQPVRFEHRQKASHAAFVRCDLFLDNPAVQAAAQGGFTNPLEVAWENVPFSFVVDWFLPIGNYLGQLDCDLGWEFLAGSLSTKLEVHDKLFLRPRAVSGWSKQSVYCIEQAHYKRLVRTVYGSMPANPGLQVKNPLSKGHVANALALLRGAFS